LDEKDAQAQSLGYKHGATKVDKARFAKYLAGQNCANLHLVSGQAGRRLGRLSDLPGRAGGREGLVFDVREEGLTVSLIRRLKGPRHGVVGGGLRIS
jgi:hypothetical protein